MIEAGWKYKVIADESHGDLELALENLGPIGWELVSVVYDPNGSRFVAFLKKRLVA